MTVDLAVETSLIRLAADVLDDASTALTPGAAGDQLHCPLVDDSLGNSALGREVVDAASRRVIQATDAARRLAELVTDAASKLRTAAAAFEAAESTAIAPPR
jgi:hypothetical protein